MNQTIDLKEELNASARILTPSLARAAFGFVRPGNRRREVRRSVCLRCSVVRRRDSQLLGDRSVDLSPEGMLVLSDEPTDEGSELLVSFQATELPIWFDTSATVTRIVEGRRRGDKGRALGLRFQSLPAVSRLILRGHLGKLPPSVAQRNPPREIGPQEERVDYADRVRLILAEK
jgi:hypothetical protein